jgi:hypothetical protein
LLRRDCAFFRQKGKLLPVDNKTLIFTLIESYKKQLSLYRRLIEIVQKALGQIVLTRGDTTALMSSFSQKQELLDAIVNERASTDEAARLWRERKGTLPQGPDTRELDDLLSKTEAAIREFLEGEEQLKKYLEHMMKKGAAPR